MSNTTLTDNGGPILIKPYIKLIFDGASPAIYGTIHGGLIHMDVSSPLVKIKNIVGLLFVVMIERLTIATQIRSSYWSGG